MTWRFGADQGAGKTTKPLGAIFDTAYVTPEFGGLRISLFDGGRTVAPAAQLAVNTGLFAQLAGSHGNADFVKLFHNSVVGIAPNATDLACFQGFLDHGDMTQAQPAELAANTDLNALNISLVGLTDSGLGIQPYLGGLTPHVSAAASAR